MSNPGVITLAEKKIGGNKSFRVEDNLGESIHFHYRDVRIDLTIKELLYLGEEANKVLLDRVPAKGFDPDLFAGDSLLFAAPFLPDLAAVDEKEIPLCELYAKSTNFLGVPAWRKLDRFPNHQNPSPDEKQVILFNEEPMIRYGSAYAAAQWRKDPSASVSVLRLSFKGNKYPAEKKLWKKWLKEKVKKVFHLR